MSQDWFNLGSSTSTADEEEQQQDEESSMSSSSSTSTKNKKSSSPIVQLPALNYRIMEENNTPNDDEGSNYHRDTTTHTSGRRRRRQRHQRPRQRRTNYHHPLQEGSSLFSLSSVTQLIRRFWCSSNSSDNNSLEWIRQYYASEGETFRKNLSHQDIKDISFAKYLFHTSSILAIVLYYSNIHKEVNDDGHHYHRTNMKKFPASISYTIRRGIPQKVHFMVWITGWYYMLRAIRNSGSKRLQLFAKQMLTTGIWTVTVCRLGQNSPLMDAFHFGGAGLYMIQHIVLLKIFNTHPYYKSLFYKSFVALLTSVIGLRQFEKYHGIPTESQSSSTTPRKRYIQLAKLSPFQQRCIFWFELVLMISENMLFTSFIQGMTSGLLPLPPLPPSVRVQPPIPATTTKETTNQMKSSADDSSSDIDDECNVTKEEEEEEDDIDEGKRIWQQQEKHLDTVSLSDDEDDDYDGEVFLDACG